jgi:hypothetical protein
MSQQNGSDPWEMETTVSGGGGEWELCPAGNYPANIVGLIDVGLHEREGDKGPYEARQFVVVMESQKKTSKGHNFLFSKMFTWSMRDNSNWYKTVSSLTGRKFSEGEKFNPKSLLGMPVFVNITQSDVEKNGKKKTYHNVENITAYPEGFPPPTNYRPPVTWSVREGTPRPDFSWVPMVYGKDISKLVSESKEFKQGLTGAVQEAPTTREIAQGAGIAATDDDIPF